MMKVCVGNVPLQMSPFLLSNTNYIEQSARFMYEYLYIELQQNFYMLSVDINVSSIARTALTDD